jgi:hypothetical protein
MTVLPDYFHPRIEEIARKTNTSETQLRGLCKASMRICKEEGKSQKLAAQETWDLLLKDIPTNEPQYYEVC